MYNLIDCLAVLLFGYCTGFLVYVSLNRRKSVFINTSIYTCIILALYLIFGSFLDNMWLYVIEDIVLIVYLLYNVRCSLKTKVKFGALHFLLLLLAYSILMIMLNQIGEESVFDMLFTNKEYLRGAVIYFSLLTFTLSFCFALLFSHYRGWNSERKIDMFSLMIPILQLVLIIYFVLLVIPSDSSQLLSFGFFCILVMLLMDLLIFTLIRVTKENVRKSERQSHMLATENLKMDYFELVKEQRREISVIRHEVGNQLQLILNLLQSKDENMEERARELADELYIKIDQTKGMRYCKNNLVNAILTVKVKDASEKGINVTINTKIDDGLPIEDFDLCSIFGNMFDNAVRAASSINSPRAKKWIKFKAVSAGGYLVIKCSNTYEDEIKTQGDRIVTTKKDSTRHGYGINQIKSIAAKYGGETFISTENNVFTIQSSLKVN